ncbi:hypothetical protein BDEG_26488 [Batrachochytrium dendrobatidis JEL423]|uniref:Uncharacterized protein n=1 Tax=Batrachochytrium dendrobatidis (strain JEL423) TaxID=403673 RepID=A0A177WU07_BATDL|nr:hypothetical protein BDEG_26488 [Batrachochytrium dendrobatidis JEL423]
MARASIDRASCTAVTLQTLKKLLQALSQAIEPDESAIHFTFQQDSTSLAAEILTIVTTELTSDHHGKFIDTLASSLLFDPKTGVLRILRSSKGISRHDRAKVHHLSCHMPFK